MSRARTSTSSLELPAADEVRERILGAVEQAIDRVSDATSPAESAGSMRRYMRNRELASAALIAGAPALARVARERLVTRRARRSAFAIVPATVVSRPFLIGTGVIGGVIASVLVIRAIRRRRAAKHHRPELASFDPTRFDLDDEVARMQDEGGDPAGAASARSRRFVRSGSESTTTR
jgi:hypothetical protein